MSPTTIAIGAMMHEKRASEYSQYVDHLLNISQPGAVKALLQDNIASKALAGAALGGLGGGAYSLYRKHHSEDPDERKNPGTVGNVLLGALMGGAGGSLYGAKKGGDASLGPILGRNLTLPEAFRLFAGQDNPSLQQGIKKYSDEINSRTGLLERLAEGARLLGHLPQ